MRIQILSDAHLEFHADRGRHFIESLEPDGVEVLVLAGDICGHAHVEATLAAFCALYAEVVYVFGNHELYGSGFEELRDSLASAGKRNRNLHVLDCGVAEIGGVRFVGTTMWFPFHPDNPGHQAALNDFRLIADFESRVYEEHEHAAGFLDATLREGDVVVTHHLPTMKSVPRGYLEDPLNRFFVAPMDELIERSRPLLWLHGHTHDSVDCHLGSTRVVANPFGYQPFALNESFEEKMVIEVAVL